MATRIPAFTGMAPPTSSRKTAGARDSPTEAGQLFGKFGWRNEATDVSLSGAYADTDLTGNGLQDMQFLENDYSSVYTKPDNTKNMSWLLNLVGTHKASDILTLSGNAFYRNIKTRTFNGDINDDALGESPYLGAPAMRPAQVCATAMRWPLPVTREFRPVRSRWPTRHFLPGPASRTSC